ncbi:MAG: hypothetical protein RR389_06800 [Christensenella sp.]
MWGIKHPLWLEKQTQQSFVHALGKKQRTSVAGITYYGNNARVNASDKYPQAENLFY